MVWLMIGTFAAALTAAICSATSAWLVWMQAKEILISEAYSELRTSNAETPDLVLSVMLCNRTQRSIRLSRVEVRGLPATEIVCIEGGPKPSHLQLWQAPFPMTFLAPFEAREVRFRAVLDWSLVGASTSDGDLEWQAVVLFGDGQQNSRRIDLVLSKSEVDSVTATPPERVERRRAGRPFTRAST